MFELWRSRQIEARLHHPGMTEKYDCGFRGKTILPISPDAGGLWYYARPDRVREAPSDQQLCGHTKCWTDGLNPWMYVLDLLPGLGKADRRTP